MSPRGVTNFVIYHFHSWSCHHCRHFKSWKAHPQLTMSRFLRRCLQFSAVITSGMVATSFALPIYDRKLNFPSNTLSSPQQILDENKNEKVAIIIGGGVCGISSAFQLHQRGYKILQFDALDGVAKGCSAATWGGMSTNYYFVYPNILWKSCFRV